MPAAGDPELYEVKKVNELGRVRVRSRHAHACIALCSTLWMRFNHWLHVLTMLTSPQDRTVALDCESNKTFPPYAALAGAFYHHLKLGAPSYKPKGNASLNQPQDTHIIRKITNSLEGILQVQELGIKVALLNG